MAITTQPYGRFLHDLTAAVHNLGDDTDYIALLTSSYTPNMGTHVSMADVTGEVTGAGYTAGGAAAVIGSGTYDANTAAVPCADVSWTSITATFRYAVLYKKTGSTAANNPLIALFNFGTDQVYNASPLTLSFPNNILTVSKV